MSDSTYLYRKISETDKVKIFRKMVNGIANIVTPCNSVEWGQDNLSFFTLTYFTLINCQSVLQGIYIIKILQLLLA